MSLLFLSFPLAGTIVLAVGIGLSLGHLALWLTDRWYRRV